MSYVGQQDWGGMADHMHSIYTVTDGNLMVELNALPDKFCISFQLLSKKPKAFDIFCGVLEEVSLPYKASNRLTRHLPDLSLPKR